MNQKVNPIVIVAGAILFFLMIVGSNISITINPGERGIIFRKFTTGLHKVNTFAPGFHLVAPWNTIFVYEVKEQKVEESMDILDKNGLSMAIDITLRYNPTYEKIGFLHEEFGRSYVDRLVIPEVRSSVRKVMGRYEAEEIYSTKRNEVESKIIEETKSVLAENNVIMKALLIRSIRLPEKIRQAIDDKLKQEQESLEYEFRLVAADKEAEAKEAGADYVGLDDYIEKIKGGWTDIDVIVTMPSIMGKIGALGRVLGPRGLMPNPKSGTVTMDVKAAVEAAKGGEVQFKVEKAGVIHAGVGKASFSEDKLAENVQAFVNAVRKAKPEGAKGAYIKKIVLSSTMGPAVTLDVDAASGA